ncbi:hypothetical protein NIES3974_27270 [Calothrix sp. NIES-3974]|nr:hypothetical protein NIES3974_27270 [Calothrix sp. NIES-3974]
MLNIFLIIIGIFLIMFSPKNSIYCQRDKFNANEGYCTIENSSFLRSEMREIPLENIQEAQFRVEQKNNQWKIKNNSEDTEEIKSQVVLVMNDTDNSKRYLPVNSDFNSHYKSQALQKKINRFLKNSHQEKLEATSKDNNQWIIAGFMSIFAAAYAMSNKK